MQFDHHLHEIEADAGTGDARGVAAAVVALEHPVAI
jgi:hypothetical protein